MHRQLTSALILAMILISSALPAMARSRGPGAAAPANATVLQIYNASNMRTVPTTITVAANTICGAYTISQIQVTVAGHVIPLNQLNSLQGWFNLNQGQIAIVTNKQGACLAG